MPLWPNFIAGAYRARSAAIDASTCVNLYLEMTEDDANPKKAVLYGTPGLKWLFDVTGGEGCRGMFQQDGRIFSVQGAHLVEFDWSLTTATPRGVVMNDGLPVTFASNGRGGEQLAVCAAGNLYILRLTTNVFSGPIALPGNFIPVMVEYINSYFLLLEKNTPKVWFSAPEDGTSWNGDDFFARSETSDNLVGIRVINDRIFAAGQQTSEFFYNTGDQFNPFGPFPGTVMQEGLVSPYAITILGESLAWLAQDNQGTNRFVVASGTTPKVISTPAVSFELATYPTLMDCEVLAYEQEGHPFVCWTFPSSRRQVTWCYDLRTKAWHKRHAWDTLSGTYIRWFPRGSCSVGQQTVVGDFLTNSVYALDLNTYDDYTTLIARERTSPYLGSDNQMLFLEQFEMGIEAGLGLPLGDIIEGESHRPGSLPKLMLDVSWDGAKTWGPVTTATLGQIGEYDAAAVWYQLGSGRQDRLVVRVRQVDPVKTVWGPGAWLRATPGTGQR